MPVENLLQQYNQLATLAGILAGFAFSAVIQLLSVDKPGKLMTTVIIIFSVSATMFLFTLFSFVMSAAAIAELNREITEMEGWGAGSFLVSVIGLSLFLAGIGLTGWLRSYVTGIITTLFAIITFCMTIWLLVSVISVFINVA